MMQYLKGLELSYNMKFLPIFAGRTAWGCRFPSELCVKRSRSLNGIQSGADPEEREMAESLEGNRS